MKIEKELSEIRTVYAGADLAGKKVMEKLYSKSVLSDIKSRVVSFETACAELGTPSKSELKTSPDEVAYGKLKIITRALNEGWKPNWDNDKEIKYFPWFSFRVGRFVFYCVYFASAYSYLGSRLCFRTEELAEYAGKQFEDLYNQFLK